VWLIQRVLVGHDYVNMLNSSLGGSERIGEGGWAVGWDATYVRRTSIDVDGNEVSRGGAEIIKDAVHGDGPVTY